MKRITLGMLLASALLLTQAVSAVPISVTAQRGVRVGDFDNGPLPGPNSPSTALGAFSDTRTENLGDNSANNPDDTPEPTTASQTSNVGASGNFSGTGHAQVGFSVLQTESVFANSFFDVFFEITVPHTYVIAGSLDANVDGGSAFAAFTLVGPNSFAFFASDFGSTALIGGGTLAAGLYHLHASAAMDNGGTADPGSYMGGQANFDFTFNLREAVVPVPGTLALLALGLAGVGVSRRKARPE